MLTIAIQAGGQSSRMGRDKALVELSGQPLIEHVLARVSDLADDLLITTNAARNFEYLGIRLVPDRIPGAGALNGLETALRAARAEHVLLLACDAPFVSQRLLKYMIEQRLKGDVVVPKHAGRFEPLQALYARSSCLPAVEDAIERGRKRMISFFSDVRVHAIDEKIITQVDPDGLSFFNVNTKAELLKAENILEEINQAST